MTNDQMGIGHTSNTISAEEYRAMIGQAEPLQPVEMTAEQYRQLMGGPTSVADYLGTPGRPHSSLVNTESDAKVEFGQWLAIESPHRVVAEYQFLEDRQFRADWAIVALKLIFEYDGYGDHATVRGMLKDSEKGNLAQIAGWMFIRVNALSCRDGSAHVMARLAIERRSKQMIDADP